MPKESFDQVLIFAHVKVHNQSNVPLFMQDVMANVRQGDGTLSVSAGSAAQYEEVFIAYPEIAAMHSNGLSPRATIAPGQTVDGNVFWAARLTKGEWDARKDLNFTVKFQYQSSLVLAPHSPVMEE
jgi:hypothetical protein